MKNRYKVDGDILTIYLDRKNGEVIETITDAKFLDKLTTLNVKWIAKWCKNANEFYVQCTHRHGTTLDGKAVYKNIYLHKFLLDSPSNEHVDHLNHIPLDNRECNLKSVLPIENFRNRAGANKNSITGARNVFWSNHEDKYVVSLMVNGRRRRFGVYEDLELADQVAKLVRNWYYGKTS